VTIAVPDSAPRAGQDTSPASERQRTRRFVELLMLLLALVVAMGAYASLHLDRSGKLPPSLPAYAAGLTLLALVAHVAVRRFARYADPVLLPSVVLLNGLGLVLIHRLDLAASDRAANAGTDAPSPDAPLQLTWTAIGVALFVVVLIVIRDHRILQRFTYTIGLVGVGLLVLPLLPGIGAAINGSRIWIRVGGLSFQPGEAAKLALIAFFAGYLVVNRDALALAGKRFLRLDLPRARDLGPILVAWLASLGVLIFQKDLGSSLLFFGVFVVLLYVATERPSWLVYGFVLFFGGAWFAFTQFGHVQTRLDLWLHAFEIGERNQIVESLYGLAAGGLIGTGLGNGHPEFVPFAKTDFIVATLGEELGLAGLMAVILIYAIIVERGLRTGLIVRDNFGKLLATGLATSLALQVFVVVGGVTRLIPLTGLTTPFMSQGGSSLIANWVIIALLLRISDAARRPVPPPAPAASDDATQVVRL
jgi:cell division protein FtsW (lipid II flippase)